MAASRPCSVRDYFPYLIRSYSRERRCEPGIDLCPNEKHREPFGRCIQDPPPHDSPQVSKLGNRTDRSLGSRQSRRFSPAEGILIRLSRRFSPCAWPIERELPFGRSHCAVRALTSEAEPFHLFGPEPRRGDSLPSLLSSGTQTLSLGDSKINRKA